MRDETLSTPRCLPLQSAALTPVPLRSRCYPDRVKCLSRRLKTHHSSTPALTPAREALKRPTANQNYLSAHGASVRENSKPRHHGLGLEYRCCYFWCPTSLGSWERGKTHLRLLKPNGHRTNPGDNDGWKLRGTKGHGSRWRSSVTRWIRLKFQGPSQASSARPAPDDGLDRRTVRFGPGGSEADAAIMLSADDLMIELTTLKVRPTGKPRARG